MKTNILKLLGSALLIPLIAYNAFSQGAPACPSINAGPNQSTCSGQSVNLAATVVSSYGTSSYSVSSIPNNAYPYSGGTQVFVNSDDVWGSVINLPFNFCFYGNTYNQCVLGANGQLTFDLTQSGAYDGYPITTAIPSTTDQPGNTIDAVFRDIDPELGGTIDYYLTGTAPCRALVVYWKNVPLYDNDPYGYYYTCSGTPNSTFELVLYENTNFIDVYVNNSYSCSQWNGGYGIIGIQNAAGTAAVTPPGRNYASTWTVNGAGEAWRFAPTGSPNYTVTWTIPPSTTPIATGLTTTVSPTTTTTYQANMVLTNCDGSTLTRTSQVTVNVTPGQPVSVSGSPTTMCKGASTTLTASGSSTYSWSPSGSLSSGTGSSVTATPTSTTTYTVTGTDASGCTATNTVAITVNQPPAITCTPASPGICVGSSTNLTASGASSYSWSPSGSLNSSTGSSVTATPSSTTTYTITGTDANGCTNTQPVTVTVNSPPTVTCAAASSTICSGSSTTLTAGGASTYSWSPSGSLSSGTGTSVTANPTATTTYTVTGTDANGCSNTTQITVNVNTSPTVTCTPSSASICTGDSTTLTVSGASTYTWSPSGSLSSGTGSSVTATPSSTTTYTVTGTDANGCTNTQNTTVTVNALPTVSITGNNLICPGDSANLSATSGFAGYSWNTGGTTQAITVGPLSNPTSYTVTVTDNNSCSNQASFNVGVGTSIQDALTSQNVSCNGSGNGSASVSVSGGNGSVSYVWSPTNDTTSSISGLVPGTYVITLTDSLGCKKKDSVNITQPGVLVANPQESDVKCYGGSDGTASASPSGGNPPYSYSWSTSPAQNTANISNLGIGTYSVTITDSMGCSTIDSVTIGQPQQALSSSVTTQDVVCNGDNTGVASVSANGGTSPYTYAWNNGGNQSTDNNIPAGVYVVTVTDANNCTTQDTATILQPPAIVAAISTQPTCQDSCQGVAVANVSGGTPPYSLLWSDGDTTSTISGLCVGQDTLTVTDSKGCISGNSFSMSSFPPLSPVIYATPDSGNSPLVVTFSDSANGGVVSAWQWDFGDSTSIDSTSNPSHTYIHKGQYSVNLMVMDTNGCAYKADYNFIIVAPQDYLIVPNVFSPNGDGVNDMFIVKDDEGFITEMNAQIFNRWGDLIYSWNLPEQGWDGRSSSGVPVAAGTYFYIIKIKTYNNENKEFTGHVTLIR